jgi:hypothetical protein
MGVIHRILLYTMLVLLGVSLFVPGLITIFRPGTGRSWLTAETVDAKNHLRSLNGMMAAVGAIALLSCLDLQRFRLTVIGLGIVMVFLVLARVYSLFIDGIPGFMTVLYLLVETAMALVFLVWPPPPP